MAKSQKNQIREINSHLDDPILHQSTVAAALGRSPQTIGRWIDEGCLPSVNQPNGLRKVRKSELLKWLEATRFGESEGTLDRVAALAE